MTQEKIIISSVKTIKRPFPPQNFLESIAKYRKLCCITITPFKFLHWCLWAESLVDYKYGKIMQLILGVTIDCPIERI